MYTLTHQTIKKNRVTSHKQYLFGLIVSGNPKELCRPRIQQLLLFCLKRNDSQAFKSREAVVRRCSVKQVFLEILQN